MYNVLPASVPGIPQLPVKPDLSCISIREKKKRLLHSQWSRRACRGLSQAWHCRHALMDVRCLDLQWQLHPETTVTFDPRGMDKPGNKNRGLLCRSEGKHLLRSRHRDTRGIDPPGFSSVFGGNTREATVPDDVQSKNPFSHTLQQPSCFWGQQEHGFKLKYT